MKSQLIGKDLEAGKDWGQKEEGATEDGLTDSVDLNLSKFLEMVKDREACVLQSTGLQRVGHSLVTEQQQDR